MPSLTWPPPRAPKSFSTQVQYYASLKAMAKQVFCQGRNEEDTRQVVRLQAVFTGSILQPLPVGFLDLATSLLVAPTCAGCTRGLVYDLQAKGVPFHGVSLLELELN